MTLYRITGLVLIVLPIAFNGLFFALGRAFSYPDILRHPTADILSRFQAGGGRLIGLWYGFAMTALLAIPMALLVQQVFPEQAALAAISGIIGALSGLVQAMGLLRWPLLVPGLAARYTAADATAGEREAVGVVFNAFHQYVGVVVGEHLGYLFTGGWTILVSIMMLGSTLFSPLLAGHSSGSGANAGITTMAECGLDVGGGNDNRTRGGIELECVGGWRGNYS